MAKPLLLFIHGLGGDARATWGHFDTLVKNDPQLRDRVEMQFFDYPTRLIDWLPWRRSLRIQDISQALRTEIDVRYVGYERILLICHSLGGLVAKHYVCDALKRGSKLAVRGVIFFATPHSGSALASLLSGVTRRHLHLRQLSPDSDFIDLVSRDWAALRCEDVLEATYVVGGQDMIVNPGSGSPPGTTYDLISDKTHSSLVKPVNDVDLSYLLVKQAARRLLLDDDDGDLSRARSALENHDSYALTTIVANRGRSWIETIHADAAIEFFNQIIDCCSPSSPEVLWSRYLLALSRLFREGDASSTAFDDQLIQDAATAGLTPLFLAERMEFARKRNDREEALRAAAVLFDAIRGVEVATSSGNAYALGTAHFLIANLYRYGGRYREAGGEITKARIFYRPTIVAHQIELAHCDYAAAVCRAMQGGLPREEPVPVVLAREFRRFADGLVTLTRSHAAWTMGRHGDAADQAEKASESFDEIRFTAYGRRARSLGALLGAWRRLEFGAPLERAVGHAPEYGPIIRGMLGDQAARGALRDWIARTRPSQVLGMLQFASAYSPDWSQDVGVFRLPPVLREERGRLKWWVETSSSLHEANIRLRGLMEIGPEVRVPLLAD
jgi:pimeloyl-ACP methyl ester carboxylesterase